MIDLVRIKVIAGSGGNGAVSFFKLKNMRYGKPDGGDGGNGGSVFAEAANNVFDLEEFRGRNLWKADVGKNGGKNRKTGESAKNLVLKVPVGTVVKIVGPVGRLVGRRFSAASKNDSSKTYQLRRPPPTNKLEEELFFDLKEAGQKILVAQGGQGGKGNSHTRFLKDKKGKKPEHWEAFNQAQTGQKGEEKELTLELKYLAQVGIIGLPNAGKSTLLANLTNARPKIADYPFTTLEPNVGVMEGIIIADIPGLIEGASKGKGLGFAFLKHIERTTLLVHVVDIANSDPVLAFKTVQNELKLYGKDLDKKKEIVVLNKIDLLDKEKLKKVTALFKKPKPILISCQTGEGLDSLRTTLLSSVKKI